MNPFTHALLEQLDDPALADFVRDWDALEDLVVRVYRAGAASPQDRQEHARLRLRLHRRYPSFRSALDPHWRGAAIGGTPAASDPFEILLKPSRARDFADNWPLMQTLPAAREALNNYLVARLEGRA